MTKGFVFGKFMPFHKGHQAMIDFAKSKVDFLYIVVCASEKETIPVFTRSHWITETYPFDQKIQIISFEYLEKNLPNTSVADKEVSARWAAQFKKMLPDVEILVTSEAYGKFAGDAMGIESIVFDQDRSAVPISATEIRENPAKHWDLLPESVKPYFQKKIVLLGTECTGKSSLAKALAEKLVATLVYEVGRDLIPSSKSFTEEQLMLVTFEHARNIEKAANEMRPFVIIDTDIHITQSYANFQFAQYLDVPDEIYQVNKADIYFYLDHNFDYVQDGTRLELRERNFLDKSHRTSLADHKIDFIEISGEWNERLEKMLAVLE